MVVQNEHVGGGGFNSTGTYLTFFGVLTCLGHADRAKECKYLISRGKRKHNFSRDDQSQSTKSWRTLRRPETNPQTEIHGFTATNGCTFRF